MKDLEYRAYPIKMEIQTDESGGPPRLVGYAAEKIMELLKQF